MHRPQHPGIRPTGWPAIVLATRQNCALMPPEVRPQGERMDRMATTQPVTLERHGAVAIIRLANPPVNALSRHLRAGLMAALDEIERTPDLGAVALVGDGRTFPAGADITEFGRGTQPPYLGDICARIEGFDRPVVAVLHGTALGGGYELALACHARVVAGSAAVGLPEVTLGILPGAGGTQRAPRLIGLAAAAEMILSGRRISAPEALDLGLVDRILPLEPAAAAIAAGEMLLNGALPARRTGTLPLPPGPAIAPEIRAGVAARAHHLPAPAMILQALDLASGPLDAGLAFERASNTELVATPASRGLIHAFFAERAARRSPELIEAPLSLGRWSGPTEGHPLTAALMQAGLTRADRGDVEITADSPTGIRLSATAEQADLFLSGRLAEISVGPGISPRGVATLFDLARRMGRVPVRSSAAGRSLGEIITEALAAEITTQQVAGRTGDQIAAALAQIGMAGALADSAAPAALTEALESTILRTAIRLLGDGAIRRPVELDAIMILGHGFPRFRGGPFHLADQIGARTLAARMAKTGGATSVPPLLARLAAENRRFAELNG